MTMIGWKLATASSSAEYSYVAADMELESALRRQNNSSNTDSRVLWFKRKVCIQFFTIIFSPCINGIAIPICALDQVVGQNDDSEDGAEDLDFKSLQAGYVSVF